MNKFEWQATESAPRNYVMTIIGGNLSYHDDSGSLYVPDKSNIDHGWGKGASSHIVGPDRKPLPKRLAIGFFSYTENQFYEGIFDLPYDKILKMFQDGYYSPNEGGEVTYQQVVVGVAPGGAVAVWLRGIDKTTEVFFGQAEKIEGRWGSLTNATHITREEYVRKSILYSLKTPEAVAALHQNGVPIGLWNTYRTRYLWQPVLTGIQLKKGLINHVQYFNGERDYLNYPLEAAIAASTRAVPKELHFVGAPPGATGKPKLVELYFNEAEIFDAFKKLGPNNQPLQLEIRNEVIDGNNKFTIWLRNDKDKIELKNTKIQTYNT